MIRPLLLWASRRPGLGRAAARTWFVRRGVRRFIPGDGRADALQAAEALRSEGVSAVFTLLGENLTSRREVDLAVDEYRALLDGIGRRELDAHLSVKLTQLGLDLGEAIAQEALDTLVATAKAAGSMIWIDMESTAYLDRTLGIFSHAAGSHGSDAVGVCVQAYLRSTPTDLDSILPFRPRLRLVKGAYAEPSNLAYDDRKEVDDAFFHLACRILESGAHLALATHDGALVTRLRHWIGREGVSVTRYEFQMLYGIGVPLRRELVAAGEPVRVLISYGPGWFPWYMRRLAERPANLWFLGKAVFGG